MRTSSNSIFDYSQGSGPTRYEFNVLMQGPGSPALAYLRTSSAANVGTDKDCEKRQRDAIQGFAERSGFAIVEEFYAAAVSGADPIEPARASRRSSTASRAMACVPSSSRMPAGLRAS